VRVSFAFRRYFSRWRDCSVTQPSVPPSCRRPDTKTSSGTIESWLAGSRNERYLGRGRCVSCMFDEPARPSLANLHGAVKEGGAGAVDPLSPGSEAMGSGWHGGGLETEGRKRCV